MKRMTPLETVEACLYWAEHDGKQNVEVPIDTLRELLSKLVLAEQEEGGGVVSRPDLERFAKSQATHLRMCARYALQVETERNKALEALRARGLFHVAESVLAEQEKPDV